MDVFNSLRVYVTLFLKHFAPKDSHGLQEVIFRKCASREHEILIVQDHGYVNTSKYQDKMYKQAECGIYWCL